MTPAAPFFSVIISTRNRPALFERALRSVLDQSFDAIEVVVVVDGSSDEHLVAYHELEARYTRSNFQYLVHQPNGHGQSYSMNCGVRASSGQYLCFLDDDDSWTDNHYLERAHRSITSCAQAVDMHYSNQKAFFADGTAQTDLVWLEDLIPQTAEFPANENDTFVVDAEFMMRSGGFGHLNCSIFRREFYLDIQGMDESIRYENDRDVFIRSVDGARTILFSTHYVSRHNIPDSAKKENMSTVASDTDKKLFQIRVYDKGISNSTQPAVLAHCRKGKVYELKHLTQILAARGDYTRAAHYAREALLNGFNPRWLGYTVYICTKSLLS